MPYVMARHDDLFTSVSGFDNFGATQSEVDAANERLRKIESFKGLLSGGAQIAVGPINGYYIRDFHAAIGAFFDKVRDLEVRFFGEGWRFANEEAQAEARSFWDERKNELNSYGPNNSLQRAFQRILSLRADNEQPLQAKYGSIAISGAYALATLQQGWELWKRDPTLANQKVPALTVGVSPTPPIPLIPTPPTVQPPTPLAPRTQSAVVMAVQDVIGASADGDYGKKTHKKLVAWAAPFGVSKTTLDREGPNALARFTALLRLTSLAELDLLAKAWRTWSRRPGRPAVPTPITPTPEPELTVEELLRRGAVQEAGFTGWFKNYWWALAAVAVVGVGGYIIWKRRKSSEPERPMLPEEV